jgi:hypothetical protein
MLEEQPKRIIGKPFEVGKVANPLGRPKEVHHVKELARKHTVDAINTLAGIMANPKEKASARVAAANAILDRGYGRAPLTFEDAPEEVTDLREAARRLAFIMNGAILRGDVVDVKAVDVTAEADKLAVGVAEKKERKAAMIAARNDISKE